MYVGSKRLLVVIVDDLNDNEAGYINPVDIHLGAM